MAAELDMSNDRANMAYTGRAPWHGLGQELQDDASIEQWMISAGMEWTVKSSPVLFKTPSVDGFSHRTFANRNVLYRSDTHAPLSVVSEDFKVVQPKEIIEFFRDLVEKHDMKLSTAGSLFDGKRFWALAELGKEFEVVNGDKVKGNLLLTTAVDGSLNTTAKFVSERVVCNNTLNIALSEKGSANLVKVSHRSQWDPEQVKMDLGLIDSSWLKFIQDMRKLASTKVSDSQVAELYQDVLFGDKQPTKHGERKIASVMDLYRKGVGAEMSYGTLWGAVNGMTELYTHGSGKRQASHQFWDGYYCGGAEKKDSVYSKALAMAA